MALLEDPEPDPPAEDPLTEQVLKIVSVIGPFVIVATAIGIPAAYFAICLAPYFDLSLDYPAFFRDIAIFHIVALSFCSLAISFSLLCAACSDPGSSEKFLNDRSSWSPFPFMTDQFIDNLPKCEKCGLPKPERCHHCSVCNKCHLKMDHHCPAVGNCVALRNFRSFLVMLVWSVIGSGIQCGFCLLEAILDHYSRSGRWIAIVYTLGSTVVAGYVGYFLSDQLHGANVNQTTIESIGKRPLKYDLGKAENLRQVFGTGTFRYLIPLPNNGMSGFEWSLPVFWKSEHRGQIW
jgi:hypothetical protein